MDENLKIDDKKVMLVEVPGGGQMKGITNIDKSGNAKVTRDDVSGSNLAKLLDVNTHDSALEAFFKKMVEQAQDPAHTGIAGAVRNIYILTKSALDKLLKVGLDTQLLEPYRVDPAVELQKIEQQKTQTQTAGGETTKVQSAGGDTSQSFQPLDPAKIDREDMERKGIRWEGIEPHLKAMTYGHKSSALVDMNPLMPDGGRPSTKGRVSLEEQQDGSIRVIPHYWKEKPDLDSPFHGVRLPDDVKANIEATRHAGRPVMLELTPGKPEPCFVSLDKHTNTLEALPVSALEQRGTIKNAAIDEDTARRLYSGERVLLEKFTTRAGYFRDGYIQVDASNRNFEWSYDGLDRNRYAQENKEIYKQKVANGEIEPRNSRKAAASDENKTDLTIHKRIKGADIPEKAYKEWSEAVRDPEKRASVTAHYIKGMTDDKGQPFNAWVRPNFDKEKFDFYKYNPKYAKSKGAEVTPASESKTQVAVNNDGKTNERSKHSQANGQPLRQGQTKPTDTQQKSAERQRPPVRRNAPPARKQGGQKM